VPSRSQADRRGFALLPLLGAILALLFLLEKGPSERVGN